MLIGKTGKFTLRVPFTLYSVSGLQGTIVGVNYISHQLSKGVNVKTSVYTPVDGDTYYASDEAANLVIVTIKAVNGKKYDIPDKYIENLYDDSLNYVESYLTVRIGPMPLNYDYSYIKSQLAAGVTSAAGVQVTTNDVFVSATGTSTIVDKAGSIALDIAREATINNGDSDYSKYISALKDNKVANDQIASLEAKLLGFIT